MLFVLSVVFILIGSVLSTTPACYDCLNGYTTYGYSSNNLYFRGEFFTRFGTQGDAMSFSGVDVNYGDYFGFDFFDTVSLIDVCFKSKCVTSYRVITYDNHWRTITDTEIEIDDQGPRYTHSCLSFDFHQSSQYCVNHVKFMRIYFFMQDSHRRRDGFYYPNNQCRIARVKEVKAKGCQQVQIHRG